MKTVVSDVGYKTPAIAKILIDDGVEPLFPYKRPMTKKEFFPKREYVYEELYDCCLCPAGKVLPYSATNREGYREYKSSPRDCAACPRLDMCTLSRDHSKIVTRHLWESCTEIREDLRHTVGNMKIYQKH